MFRSSLQLQDSKWTSSVEDQKYLKVLQLQHFFFLSPSSCVINLDPPGEKVSLRFLLLCQNSTVFNREQKWAKVWNDQFPLWHQKEPGDAMRVSFSMEQNFPLWINKSSSSLKVFSKIVSFLFYFITPIRGSMIASLYVYSILLYSLLLLLLLLCLSLYCDCY